MTKLKDSQQRIKATDPQQSFIVQAPAGSGKTEILTQRYLRLLSTVNAPEQIIALTFTRKAASEMRDRILRALNQAALGVKPLSPHQQQTQTFAANALIRSEEHHWQLLENPSRLRIITIDSLCQTLSHAIPLHEKQIPYAQITDKPSLLYQAAARACLDHAILDTTLHPPLKQLLLHLDNRQDRLLALLSDLLKTRAQWLSVLYTAREQTQDRYEQMLQFIEQHELARFQQAAPLSLRNELCQLAREFATTVATPQDPHYLLANWHDFSQIDRSIASSLASLLLTSQDNLRKRFDHHIGLKRGSCSDDLYTHFRASSENLLSKLEAHPPFLEALLKVKALPAPHYNPEQWQVLQALFTLLPLLVGHLHLLFNENNAVDFTAISQQALLALGSAENPTDLTLYLDNAIHHILVDEFQDTSIQQFQLLTQLVQGWQPHDGRTLFVVGDPMQSIYRFRQAEVGLFLKAKQQGIGPVALTFLELSCNFRSTTTLVDWVNHQFNTIFPHVDDIESGAISFHSSSSILPAGKTNDIQAYQLHDQQQEAQAIVQLITEQLENYPEDNLAILVRSRRQLTALLPLLRKQGIPFQGVDIELLSKLPHLRDLYSLTQALLMPANRLAWLALLRSPCCGLLLADLHVIANFDKKKSIYHALSHLDELPTLSEEGRLRAQFVFNILRKALASRHQQSLVTWVAHTFRQLHGDQILNATQQADLESFWDMLERLTPTNQFPDLSHLKSELSQLYSQRVNSARLQIMTIHKAKGLEFDTVILPGLSTKSHNTEKPLLRFLKFPSQQHEELFLVSPVKAAHHEQCMLYDYLSKLDAEKENYELARLFYVAVTRAKKRLYLFDNSDKTSGHGTFRSLLKNQPVISKDMINVEAVLNTAPLPLLYRLPSAFYIHSESLLPENHPSTTTCFDNKSNNARQLGIVAHELLQWVCDHHSTTIDKLPWALVMNQLKQLGFDEQEQATAYQTLYQQLNRLFSDPIGQWICKFHTEERNEYELLTSEEGVVSTKIIDRTFVSQDQRWIIDFKTGQDDEMSQKHHRQQINNYAKIFSIMSSQSIACGLYYLANGKWVTWTYCTIDEVCIK